MARRRACRCSSHHGRIISQNKPCARCPVSPRPWTGRAALVGLDVARPAEYGSRRCITLMCLLKTHEIKARITRESRTLLAKVAFSCCGASPEVRRRSQFSRLVGRQNYSPRFLRHPARQRLCRRPRRGHDAASLKIVASCYAARPGLLRSALTHLFLGAGNPMGKFRRWFDAFWLGRLVAPRAR